MMNHDKRCVTIKGVSLMLCVSENTLVDYIDIMRLDDDARKAGYRHDDKSVKRLLAMLSKLKADTEEKVSRTY